MTISTLVVRYPYCTIFLVLVFAYFRFFSFVANDQKLTKIFQTKTTSKICSSFSKILSFVFAFPETTDKTFLIYNILISL